MDSNRENMIEELNSLRSELLHHDERKNNHIGEACKFFRFLSGKSIRSYASLLGISHTYWIDLESGARTSISDTIKEKIALISGLSYETVKNIYDDKQFDSNHMYELILDFVEEHFQDKVQGTKKA